MSTPFLIKNSLFCIKFQTIFRNPYSPVISVILAWFSSPFPDAKYALEMYNDEFLFTSARSFRFLMHTAAPGDHVFFCNEKTGSFRVIFSLKRSGHRHADSAQVLRLSAPLFFSGIGRHNRIDFDLAPCLAHRFDLFPVGAPLFEFAGYLANGARAMVTGLVQNNSCHIHSPFLFGLAVLLL